MNISEEVKAYIELTAERVVEKAMVKVDQRIDDKIETHTYKCQATKLGAFKVAVISIAGGVVSLLGQWIAKRF
jgi:hypothetical protein